MSFLAIVFLGKCPSGQMSSGQISFWANVFLGKCPPVQMSSGQLSFWANVFLSNWLLGECLSGQMSFWANVVGANVLLGKRRMGKCLRGNVSGQMSYGQMSSNHIYAGGFFLSVFSYTYNSLLHF
jgi:hypothetical protein